MISTTLMIVFLIFALLEMYFIGKYISFGYAIFSNKIFSEFALGAFIYLLSSFLIVLPFVWIHLEHIYYGILIISKDFLIVVFLLARRDKFKGIKINYKFLFFLFLSMIIIPTFYELVFPNIFDTNEFKQKRNYDVWFIVVNSLSKVTSTNINKFSKIVISPIASVIIYSVVTSIFLMFSKRDNPLDYFISLILTLILLVLFNSSSTLNDAISIYTLLFLIVPSYNLLVYSRRRYGSIFAIITFVTFGLNTNMFWPLLIVAFSISSVYVISRKPKASLFVAQLLSPSIILSTFFAIEYSAVIGWTLIIIGVFAYSSIFIFGRIKMIESANKMLTKNSYWYPFIIVITFATIALVYGLTEENIYKNVLWDNVYIFDFKNNIIKFIINVTYFVIVILTFSYSIYWVIKKEKSVKWKLLVYISALFILIGFNPGFHVILRISSYNNTYKYMSVFPIVPLIIAGTGYLRTKLIK